LISDTSFSRLIENVNISFDMFDDSHEDISINFSNIDRILDESDREKHINLAIASSIFSIQNINLNMRLESLFKAKTAHS
jgi:rRNA maturation endonuclease Nob1